MVEIAQYENRKLSIQAGRNFRLEAAIAIAQQNAYSTLV